MTTPVRTLLVGANCNHHVTTPLFPPQVHLNGQHDCVTDVQINYLSLGSGSKDGDGLIDELIAMLAEQLQGEMVVVFLFDNCAVGKNGAVTAQLPQALVDRGLVSVAEVLYFPTYHGKYRADGRFGGYEKKVTSSASLTTNPPRPHPESRPTSRHTSHPTPPTPS